MAALDAALGNVSMAALRLGWPLSQLQRQIRIHPKLKAHAARLRRARRDQQRSETLTLLEMHQGNIGVAARAAGLSKSTFLSRVKRSGLYPHVLATRPQPPTQTQAKSVVLDALLRHCGHRSRVQWELQIGERALRSRLIKFHLLAKADALNAKYNVMGPRTKLPRGQEFHRRRGKLIRLLDKCAWDLNKAPRLASVAPATFYEHMRILKIQRTPPRTTKKQGNT